MGVSRLHTELAQRALIWLEGRSTGRGIRGCDEVILNDGYVADAVAICGLQLAHEKLFLGTRRESINRDAAPDYVFVFESKVSRSDFIKTFKNNGHIGDRMNAEGNFHFVVTPKNMVSHNEVPAFWGLLEQSGGGLKIIKMPTYVPITNEKLRSVGYQILWSIKSCKFVLYKDEINKFRNDQLELDVLDEGLFQKQ